MCSNPMCKDHPNQVKSLSDKPVLPLTLYRITLETDNIETYEKLVNFFSDENYYLTSDELNECLPHIIGVEARERIRVNHDKSSNK